MTCMTSTAASFQHGSLPRPIHSLSNADATPLQKEVPFLDTLEPNADVIDYVEHRAGEKASATAMLADPRLTPPVVTDPRQIHGVWHETSSHLKGVWEGTVQPRMKSPGANFNDASSRGTTAISGLEQFQLLFIQTQMEIYRADQSARVRETLHVTQAAEQKSVAIREEGAYNFYSTLGGSLISVGTASYGAVKSGRGTTKAIRTHKESASTAKVFKDRTKHDEPKATETEPKAKLDKHVEECDDAMTRENHAHDESNRTALETEHHIRREKAEHTKTQGHFLVQMATPVGQMSQSWGSLVCAEYRAQENDAQTERDVYDEQRTQYREFLSVARDSAGQTANSFAAACNQISGTLDGMTRLA